MSSATSYVSAITGGSAAEYKRVPNVGLLAQGSDDSGMYFAQINPVTGGLLTDTQLDLSPYEEPDQPLANRLSNGVSFLATDSGAGGDDVLRTILATRHESASTPLSARLSNGSGFFGADFGASTGALRVSALLGNASGLADFGAGTYGAQTLRVILADDQMAITLAASSDTHLGAIETAQAATALDISAIKLNSDTLATIVGNIDVNLFSIYAEAVNQTGSLVSIDSKLPAALGQKASADSLGAVLSTEQEAILASIDLNNGFIYGEALNSNTLLAAMDSVLLGIQSTLSTMDTSLSSIDGKTGGGSVSVNTARFNYDTATSGTNVDSTTWQTVIASTTSAITKITLADTSGEAMELGIGAAPARVLLIPRGGLAGIIPLYIPASSKVSVRGVSGTASGGDLLFNGLS